MGNDKPVVAVVIPSWNGASDLRNCIESVQTQSGVEPEILVVDNGSTDGTIDYLQDAGIPHISLPKNLGFAAAVNLGFASTEASTVATVNADTVLEPNALAEMLQVLESDPRVGGVQPRILELIKGRERDPSDPEATIYSLGQALTADGRAREDGIGQRQGERGYEPREIFGVCGAACVFRRELIDQLGGYDESYFAFYEDVDLNVRSRILGWEFRVAPQAVVWHVGNASWHAGFKRPDAENARLVARNRIWTQMKFMPVTALPRIFLVELGAATRAALARRFRLTMAGKWAAIPHLGDALAKRRELRQQGDLERVQSWLGESRRAPAEIMKNPVPPVGRPVSRD